MSERHWAEWTVEGYDSHIRTTPELLAEMGAERVWVCWQYGTIEAFQHCEAPPRHHGIDANGMRCGWYQIVKETNDE